jgi:hypothetical protein
MKRSSRKAELTDSVQRRLNMYALAAGAAGVGMLAQPAEAKIVYTPAHVPIIGIVDVDLNHDGIVDLRINLRPYDAEAFLAATSLRQNRVWGSNYLASHLRAGVPIGQNRKKFAKGNVHCPSSNTSHTCKNLESFLSFSGSAYSRGPWAKYKNGFLGLKFYINGKVHFGWARLQRVALNEKWVLTGYAYETVARKPIVTGQKKGPAEISSSQGKANPSTLAVPAPQHTNLGMLALGAAALSVWRRDSPHFDNY